MNREMPCCNLFSDDPHNLYICSYHSFASSTGTEAVIVVGIIIEVALIQLLLFAINVQHQCDEVTAQLVLNLQVFVARKLVAQRPIVVDDGSSEIFRQLHQHWHGQFFYACQMCNRSLTPNQCATSNFWLTGQFFGADIPKNWTYEK